MNKLTRCDIVAANAVAEERRRGSLLPREHLLPAHCDLAQQQLSRRLCFDFGEQLGRTDKLEPQEPALTLTRSASGSMSLTWIKGGGGVDFSCSCISS